MEFSEVMPSKNTLEKIHNNLLIPASNALTWIESNGFNVDSKKLTQLTKAYEDKLASIDAQINGFSEVISITRKIKKPFNMNSSDHLRMLVFSELQLGHLTNGKLTEGGKLSTDKSVLASLEGQHPIIDLIQEHKKYSTLYKMFIKPMPEFICNDGKIHSTYNLNGTVTGRLSSNAPNMQQIPRNIKDNEDKKGFQFEPELNIKHLFIPSKKHVLIQADYSQMELRVLADYSNDAFLIQAFKDGKDIHLATGEKLAGEPIDKKSIWRTRAKTVNFGLVYGKTAVSLGKELNMSTNEAQEFIDKYFTEMPDVLNWLTNTKNFALENGYVTSMFGRVRKLGKVQSTDQYEIEETLRQATNMPIQSTASDYTLSSLVNFYDLFMEYKFKSKIVATVHDSIIFDVESSEIKTILSLICEVMENPENNLIYWKRQVPLAADLEYSSKSWATLKEM